MRKNLPKTKTMASRPYIQKTIINLQELFEASRDNPAELKKLATELSHRKVPKAVALTKKVSDALKGAPSKFDEPPGKASRPYIQKTIVNLQELFEASRDNPVELKKLATELSHRKVPKAVALTKKVSDALKGAPSKFDEPPGKASRTLGSAPPAEYSVIDCQGCRERLPIKLDKETREFNCPNCKANYHASISGGVLSVVFMKTQKGKAEPAPSKDGLISLKNAYRIFEADENKEWELIELARRSLIQQYHPDKIAALSEKHRAVAELEVKRIKAAYDVIRKARGY